MMNPDGTNGNIIVAFVGIAISMVVGFVLTMFFYRDGASKKVEKAAGTEMEMKSDQADRKEIEVKADQSAEKGRAKTDSSESKAVETLGSPLKGSVVALADVQDEAFSSGALGDGAAIDPEEGILYAPEDGVISACFPTGHAIGLTTNSGMELLMHVGMDTVQLEGKGFHPLVQAGDTVTKGQKLLEFDIDFIRGEGYSLVTPVLITNADEFSEISITNEQCVNANEIMMTVTR